MYDMVVVRQGRILTTGIEVLSTDLRVTFDKAMMDHLTKIRGITGGSRRNDYEWLLYLPHSLDQRWFSVVLDEVKQVVELFVEKQCKDALQQDREEADRLFFRKLLSKRDPSKVRPAGFTLDSHADPFTINTRSTRRFYSVLLRQADPSKVRPAGTMVYRD